MRNLSLTRRTGLSLIIFISFGFSLWTSNVKAIGSFQLQVLAAKIPDECLCRGSSGSFSTESKEVSASNSKGDTFYSENTKNITQNYNKTNLSFNVNQNSSVILDFLNARGKNKGETQNKHDSETGSIKFANLPSTTSSTAPHESGINTNSNGARKTSGISDTPTRKNSAHINATKFEDETWTAQNSSICKSLDLTVTTCLAHHQLRPAKEFKCTLGQATSYQTISLENLDTLAVVRLQEPPIISIPFSYAWPGAFTLRVVTAWKCGNRTIRENMTVTVDSLVPSSKWVVLPSGSSQTVSNTSGEENRDTQSEPQINSSTSNNPQRRSTHKPRNLDRGDKKIKRSIPPYNKSNIHSHLRAKKRSIDSERSFKMISKLKSTMKSTSSETILDAVAKEVFKDTSRERPPISGAISADRMTLEVHRTSTRPRSLPRFIKQLSGIRDDKDSKRHPETVSQKHSSKRNSRRRRSLLRFGKLSSNLKSDRILNSIDTRRSILNKSKDEKLLVAVRVLCSDNYYGANCTHFCRARDDFLGHFTCTATGQQVCTDGWRGRECSKAICSTRCLPSRSSCPAPNTCLCRAGWYGHHCDRCRPGPGCLHGTCSLPGQCVCQFGWTGPRCDVEQLFCDLHKPCKNGGSCTHLGKHIYKCACPKGYKGRHCEIFECYDGFCHHEGVCSVSQGTRICQCPPLYSGSRCQFMMESWRAASSTLLPSLAMLSTSSSPLSSLFSSTKLSSKNATCSEVPCTEENRSSPPLTKRGSCLGALCDRTVLGEKTESADSCQTLSCHNGGECTDSTDTEMAFCACPEPYIGTQCLEDRYSSGLLSPCSSSPCLYGGKCFNIIKKTKANATERYSCKCLEGFSGDTCEKVISMDTSICASTPCRNGGTCVEYDGEFFCACTDNFRGLLCEKRRKSRRVTRLKVKIETTFYSPSSSPPSSSSSSAAESINMCHLVNKDDLDLTLIRRMLYLAIPVIIAFYCIL